MFEKLIDLGFTTYQAKAYVTLVQRGALTAHFLAKYSGVPHGKIYPVLASLEEKKIVRAYGGRPQRFAATEPSVVLRALVEEKEREAAQYKKKAAFVLKNLGELGNVSGGAAESIKIVEGYKNYLNLSVSLHAAAKKEWLTISELSLYKPHIDAYRRNIKQKMIVRILTSKEEATPAKLKIWKKLGAQIRFIDQLPTKFSVIDEREATIRIAEGDKYISLLVRNLSLAQSLRTHFLTLWKSAERS